MGFFFFLTIPLFANLHLCDAKVVTGHSAFLIPKARMMPYTRVPSHRHCPKHRITLRSSSRKVLWHLYFLTDCVEVTGSLSDSAWSQTHRLQDFTEKHEEKARKLGFFFKTHIWRDQAESQGLLVRPLGLFLISLNRKVREGKTSATLSRLAEVSPHPCV